MNIQTQQSKKNDAVKVAAEYQKAVVQNQKAAPNENVPDFTAPVPGAAQKQQVPVLQAAKGNDEVMSQPPQPEATPAPAVNPIPKETAQEAVHQVMPKAEARKIADATGPKSPLEKTPS